MGPYRRGGADAGAGADDSRDWLQFLDHSVYGTAMASGFIGFAPADPAMFYVQSNAAVDARQCAVHALHRGSAAGCPAWQAPEEVLCLTGTRENLGMHYSHS